MPGIETRELIKDYGRDTRALRRVNLVVGGGMFGLLGPNGAGKTTLMRILATLLKPTSGTAMVDGLDVQRDKRAIRERLGYLPQEYGLYPNLTAYEFMDYMAHLQGIRQGRKAMICALLDRVGLTAISSKKIGTFSGGNKQRLGIAQALLGDPQILIVDEPTAGLDPVERVNFRNLLVETSRGKTVILSTHIVADVETTCQDMAVLQAGEVIFRGTPVQLRDKVKGLVWQARVSAERLAEVKKNFAIVSMAEADGVFQVRLVGTKEQSWPAEPMQPTLEDGYIALLEGVIDHGLA